MEARGCTYGNPWVQLWKPVSAVMETRECNYGNPREQLWNTVFHYGNPCSVMESMDSFSMGGGFPNKNKHFPITPQSPRGGTKLHFKSRFHCTRRRQRPATPISPRRNIRTASDTIATQTASACVRRAKEEEVDEEEEEEGEEDEEDEEVERDKWRQSLASIAPPKK